MQTGMGRIIELLLEDGLRSARLECPGNFIPYPGQFLLAGDGAGEVLPVPLFQADSAPGGFIASPPVPDSWKPGQEIHLRGPLGHGFDLPPAARRVALVPYDDVPSRLRALIRSALTQGAAVVLVSDLVPDTLPDEVEVQPVKALAEVCTWADYAAFDVSRANLNRLRDLLRSAGKLQALDEAQVLIRTPVPCGGVAECGVCAVTVSSGWRFACKDGPVFAWRELE